MKMPNCHRRYIFLEIFINFSMIKASLSIHVHVTLLAWFTVKSLIYKQSKYPYKRTYCLQINDNLENFLR